MSQLSERIICQISIVVSVAVLKKTFYGSKDCDISRLSDEWVYLLPFVALLIKTHVLWLMLIFFCV